MVAKTSAVTLESSVAEEAVVDAVASNPLVAAALLVSLANRNSPSMRTGLVGAAELEPGPLYKTHVIRLIGFSGGKMANACQKR